MLGNGDGGSVGMEKASVVVFIVREAVGEGWGDVGNICHVGALQEVS